MTIAGQLNTYPRFLFPLGHIMVRRLRAADESMPFAPGEPDLPLTRNSGG